MAYVYTSFFASNTQYCNDILRHDLTYSSSKNYHLTLVKEELVKDRAFSFLTSDQLIDVVFSSANKKRVNNFQAIEFPLLKLLFGRIIPVVTTKNKVLFIKVS